MSDVYATETPQTVGAGSEEPGEEMSDDQFQSAVRRECEDSENWQRQDITPGREKGLRYYNGECDYPAQDGRSAFVMRTVRDSIEQSIPSLMRIFTGGTNIVSFQSVEISEQADVASQEATDAFHHVYWNQNPGWKNTLTGLKDATKAKTCTFKAYIGNEVKVVPEPFYGMVEMLEARLEDPDTDVEELEIRREGRLVPGPFGVEGMEVSVAEAVLRVKTRKRKICIDMVPPEEFLINRDATGTGPNEYRLIGNRTVKTVSDAVDMGVPWDVATQHSGTTANQYTSSRNDQVKRARQERSGIIYERNPNDPASEPLVIYDLFMYVDKDGDGHAELRHIIGIGDGPAYIHEDELAEEHYFFTAPAIAIEHNVIGDSMADNLIDLQDVETQLSRNINNNASQVANPRPEVVEDQVDMASLRSTKFGAEVKMYQPGAVNWLLTPYIGDKLLQVRESYNETRAERTGISKESQGLAAQNIQSSSTVGVLAVLGAGNTQPEMMAATIAHYAFVPMARYVVKLIKQLAASEEGMTIRTKAGLRQINPQTWPDEMDIEVKIGLGTGTRDENLAALNQIKTDQTNYIQMQEAMGAPDLMTSADKLAETLHRMAKLSGLGDSTSFWSDPEEVKARLQQMRQMAASKPPEPSEEDKRNQTELQKTQIQEMSDIQQTQIKAETDITIQAMKDRIDELDAMLKDREMQLEAAIALQQAAQGEALTTNDVNISQG